MRSRIAMLLLVVWASALVAPATTAQQVVDRIVARINGDVLTLSELRELASFQQLTGAKPGTDAELLRQLVDQWMVSADAHAEQFPRPSEAVVTQALGQMEAQFPSPDAFHRHLKELELTQTAVRRQLERQVFLLRYLDQKFRAAVQVDAPQVESYYQKELAQQMAARGQQAPPLESVQDQIRELLVQREISRLAERWLEESRANVKLEILPGKSGR